VSLQVAAPRRIDTTHLRVTENLVDFRVTVQMLLLRVAAVLPASGYILGASIGGSRPRFVSRPAIGER
jgi:hypothetical protein